MTDSGPIIAVLLATYNGGRFLTDQLNSLASQTASHIDIWASDDGSTDGTRAGLEAAAAGWTKGRFVIIDGPRQGTAVANFRHLILQVAAGYDYYAYADQDDIWLPSKLANAVDALESVPGDAAAVHCARTRLIDAEGRETGDSMDFHRPPSFRNALVQSLAGGNTMVLNSRAFALVQASSQRTGYVSHDWWTYQIVAGAGGQMLYCHQPDTLYRQHAGNEIGANLGAIARARRIAAVFGGRLRAWNDLNVMALRACGDLLTVDNRAVLDLFEMARRGSPARRVARLRQSGVYRQTRGGHVMLYVAALTGLL